MDSGKTLKCSPAGSGQRWLRASTSRLQAGMLSYWQNTRDHQSRESGTATFRASPVSCPTRRWEPYNAAANHPTPEPATESAGNEACQRGTQTPRFVSNRSGGNLNSKRKGSRNEHRSMAVLEAAGYRCTRSAASLGEWDIVGIGSTDVVLCQVKTRDWPGSAEMETLKL